MRVSSVTNREFREGEQLEAPSAWSAALLMLFLGDETPLKGEVHTDPAQLAQAEVDVEQPAMPGRVFCSAISLHKYTIWLSTPGCCLSCCFQAAQLGL